MMKGIDSVFAWYPNARGTLTRPADKTIQRAEVEGRFFSINEVSREIINRVEEVAMKDNISVATVSTSWVFDKGYYPIVGMNSIGRVKEGIEATNLHLAEEETKYLV